jgi:hypothetical protein
LGQVALLLNVLVVSAADLQLVLNDVDFRRLFLLAAVALLVKQLRGQVGRVRRISTPVRHFGGASNEAIVLHCGVLINLRDVDRDVWEHYLLLMAKSVFFEIWRVSIWKIS